MSLYESIEAVARERRGAAAVTTVAGTLSFDELLERTREVAERFERAGIGPGHAVIARLPNEPTFLATLLACARRRVAFAPLEWSAPAAEARRTLAEFGACGHFVGDARDDGLPDAPSRLLFDHGAVVDDLRRGSPVDPELADAAMVQFTSGSTGEPKGILVSDAAMLARVRHLSDALELGPDDRTLCALPLSHSHGVDCLALPSLLNGGELVLHPPEAAAPNTLLKRIEDHRITFFSTVPSFYALAVKLLAHRDFDLSSLRLPFCGSAALSAEVAEAFLDAFGVAIRQGYGLAEVGPVTLDLDAGRTRRFDSIGRPMPGVSCRVSDEGELIVSSTSLAHGYFRQPELWSQHVAQGEFHSRDLVRVDDDGYYYLVGRMSRMINVDGGKVNPIEVEEALLELESVTEAFVTDAEDAVTGSRVVAHVVAERGTAAEPDLRAHVRARLAPYKCPSAYVFHDELPKSALGKVQPERLPSP